MKRVISVLGAGALCASLAVAGGVENKTNLTTGYARNPSRNVEASRPEAAFYNIAGTAFLADGLYAEIGNQFVFKKYSNDWDGIAAAGISGGETSDDTTVFFYPDLDVVYKKDKLAIFGTFGIYAGGGTLNYDDGSCLTSALLATMGAVGPANKHELKISSITYGGQIGAAFKPIDILSVSAAVRLTYGTQSMKLKAAALAASGNHSNKIEYDASAFAVAPVIGVHLRPMDILDFSLQWQGASYMNYEIDEVKGNTAVGMGLGITEGKKFHTDIPMALNFGAGMRVCDPLYVNAGFTYYFNKAADLNSALGDGEYKDSFEISCGVDYTINDKWGLGFGLCYGNQGQDSNSVFSPVLDSLTVGLGVEFKPIYSLTLTLAGMYSFYFDEDYDFAAGQEATLSKKLGIVSIGATYKFF